LGRSQHRSLALGTNLSEIDRMAQYQTPIERIEEAAREIATLFIALAPLDVVLGADRPYAFTYALIFVAVGVIFFVLTLFSERHRSRA
jgi:uncharacterized MAPEG superfamily protein